MLVNKFFTEAMRQFNSTIKQNPPIQQICDNFRTNDTILIGFEI